MIGLEIHRDNFYYKYCRRGHLIYSKSSIESSYCDICGQPFVNQCSKCGKPLHETFLSTSTLGSGKPAHPPVIPGYCPNCGAAFPWNSKLNRAKRLIGKGLIKSWNSLAEIIKTIIKHT